MTDRRFIRVHNKVIHMDSIAYVDFLDSGRSMIFMRGLTQEKQNIPVDPDETARLRAVLEGELGPEAATPLRRPRQLNSQKIGDGLSPFEKERLSTFPVNPPVAVVPVGIVGAQPRDKASDPARGSRHDKSSPRPRWCATAM